MFRWSLPFVGVGISNLRFFLYLLFLHHRTCLCAGSDRLSLGQSLYIDRTLVSQAGVFELGFFRLGTSSDFYLGIWYSNLPEKYYVWVAKREVALNYSAILRLSIYELTLSSGGTKVWSAANGLLMPHSTEAVLLDSGNFVLRDGSKPSTIYWQSFDYPTDTLLPGAKLGIDRRNGHVQRLISWKTKTDPSPGMYSFTIDGNGFFIEWNKSYRYWSSGTWDGSRFSNIPELNDPLVVDTIGLSNITFERNKNESYLTYSPNDHNVLSRIVMDDSGMIMQQLHGWGLDLLWARPNNQSDIYAFCGAFGVFRSNSSTLCECVQGFTPSAPNDWSSGCDRKTDFLCQSKNKTGGTDRFLRMSILSLPENSRAYPVASAGNCESECIKNCSCSAYAYNGSGCLIWKGDLLNLHQAEAGGGGGAGVDIHIRLAASEFQPGTNEGNDGITRSQHSQSGIKRKAPLILGVVIPLSLIFLCLLTYFLWKRNLIRKGDGNEGEDLLVFDFDSDPSSTTNASNSMKTKGKTSELPLFSYRSVAAATGDFLEANKLGEGGFGPVYKGILPKGQEIAVKRLSKRSGQGIAEFRNEAILIAKLQHKNLVKLLGSCIQQDENILIYEYMQNKSLDFFLFDPTKRGMLDWGKRIRIIDGISQGLLYLHQYSRVRIIHRDLKPNNILLDGEMNPKISDFGMARMFGGNETEANTARIVGTYGYMSPEYAMHGQFSVKSDVFSFGVLLLEILSGRKNTSFYQADTFTLLGHAWELWCSDRGLDLMDPILKDAPSTSMLLRYLHMGLLCVQESATDRPTMSDVVSMIANEHAPLPLPKQPAFILKRSLINSSSLRRNARIASINYVTLSTVQGR